MKNEIFNKYELEKKYQRALSILDEGFEDAFSYLNNENIYSRLRSTNCIERLGEEEKKRKGDKNIS